MQNNVSPCICEDNLQQKFFKKRFGGHLEDGDAMFIYLCNPNVTSISSKTGRKKNKHLNWLSYLGR